MIHNFVAWAWGAECMLLGSGWRVIFTEVTGTAWTAWALRIIGVWLALNLLIVVLGYLCYRVKIQKERKEH